MNKPKLSMGDFILTNDGKIMLIIGGEKEGDTWRYYCNDRLNSEDKSEHYVREHEVHAVFRNNEWDNL